MYGLFKYVWRFAGLQALQGKHFRTLYADHLSALFIFDLLKHLQMLQELSFTETAFRWSFHDCFGFAFPQ